MTKPTEEEVVYYDDTYVRVTNRRLVCGHRQAPLKDIKSISLGIFRPVDEARQNLVMGMVALTIFAILIATFPTTSFSTNNSPSWLLSAALLLVTLFSVSRIIISIRQFLSGGAGLAEGEVYGIVLTRPYLLFTTLRFTALVSTDRSYIERLVSLAQAAIDKTAQPHHPFRDSPDKPPPPPLIADGALIVGDKTYSLSDLRSIKLDTRWVAVSAWISHGSLLLLIGLNLLFMPRQNGLSIFTPELYWAFIVIWLIAIISQLLLAENNPGKAHTVIATGAFGKVILYASMERAQAQAVRESLVGAIGAYPAAEATTRA